MSDEGARFDWSSTGVQDLDELLSTGDPARAGINCHGAQGYFGVIVGPAGSGKSILALQLCCAYLAPKESDPRAAEKAEARTAIYLSQENPKVIVSKIEKSFERFGRNIRVKPDLERVVDESALHVLQLPMNAEAQLKLLRAVRELIYGVPHVDGSKSRMLLCVDNANSLDLKTFLEIFQLPPEEAGEPLQERDDMKRYRQACANLNTYFVFEQTTEGSDAAPISVTAEAYAADVLIHVAVDNRAGYRQRYLEIVKSKNQYYYRGKHCFSIASADAGPVLRTPSAPSDASRYGIRVYPSVATQLSKLAREEELQQRNPDQPSRWRDLRAQRTEPYKLGIAPEGHDDAFSVDPFTCTVLVSDIDIMATLVAGEFCRLAKSALYISFLHREQQLKELLPDTGESVRFKYFAPEYIDSGKLMRDIEELIAHTTPEVVVIDNAFELRCKYPLVSEPQHFLAALVELFVARAVTSLIVDTVEVGLGRNPLEKSLVAGLGDNVLLLRNIEFQSQAHTVFSVQKHFSRDKPLRGIWHLDHAPRTDADGQPHPEGQSQPRFVARRTFDAYKNVLTGRPEPVTFAVSLYEDERRSPFSRYLSGMRHALNRTFGRSISVDCYSADEYPRVQNLILQAEGGAVADCHIIALDEFWLQRLIGDGRLENITPYAADLELTLRGTIGSPGGIEDPFVTAASDTATLVDKTKPNNWPHSWYAVPILNNFGVLCCDPADVGPRFSKLDGGHRLESWLKRKKGSEFSWDDLVTLKEQDAAHADSGRSRFFTFCMNHVESSVSFLIELALSVGSPFVPKENPDDPDDHHVTIQLLDNSAWNKALTLLLSLLDDDDLVQLASGQVRPSSREPLALFSRQWVSTLGCLRGVPRRYGEILDGTARRELEAQERLKLSKLEPFELPIGPGKKEPTPVSGAWYLGILKGSAAVRVGVQILKAFCTPDSELSKWNSYLGAPVRLSFYASERSASETEPEDRGTYGPFEIPYGSRFAEIGELQAHARKSLRPVPGEKQSDEDIEKLRNELRRTFKTKVLNSNRPFYRMRVQDYERVSLVLRRLLARAAIGWLRPEKGRAERNAAIADAIVAADREYRAMAARSGPTRRT